jgi:hypothetical protein
MRKTDSVRLLYWRAQEICDAGSTEIRIDHKHRLASLRVHKCEVADDSCLALTREAACDEKRALTNVAKGQAKTET